MQTHSTAAKETSSHASKAFFGSHLARAPAFFAPQIQAKCAACENEDKLQRKMDSEEMPELQAKCAACDHEPPRLQRRATNVQPKLTIGTPNDRFEQEADRNADMVMRMPEPATEALPVTSANAGRIQREPAAGEVDDPDAGSAAGETCSIKDEPAEPGEENEETEDHDPDDKDDETPVSPKREGADSSPPADLESRIDSSRGGGSPLPSGTRDFMESRFGYDFSGVRVHTGAESAGMNRDIRSLAFTSGHDIHFAPGQYQPDSNSGKQLLAHELTHVVQQSGGGGGATVREKADRRMISRTLKKPKGFETKEYQYLDNFSGTAMHGVVEKLLRESDTSLVTEAAIPGADRHSPELNKIGVADLYKSDPAHTVSGVKAYKEGTEPKNWVSMNNPTSVGTQPAVSSSPALGNKKDDDGKRTWIGDFPKNIWLGELKPWYTPKVISGLKQLWSYRTGYNEFLKQARVFNGGKTRSSITFNDLELKLPAYLDFDQFESQHSVKSTKSTSGDRRLWVGYAGNGVYLYRTLVKDLAELPTGFKEHAEKARDFKEQLTEKHPRNDRLVNTKPVPGATVVQRYTRDRPKEYWPKRRRAWEDARSKWGKSFRQELVTKFEGHRERMRFAKKLGKRGKISSTTRKQISDYKSVMFWSGRGGKFLGRIRFLLGSAWDKIVGVFENHKKPTEKLHGRIRDFKPKGIKIGWKNQLINVIVTACKSVFTAFIVESFNFFAKCFESAMDKLMERFNEVLNEKFGEEICRARKDYEEAKARLEAEWGDAITKLGELVDAITSVTRWIDIVGTMVNLIRAGVQLISCVSPPALGCLWGLVAQLGIGTMVGLVIGTQWFNDNIITPQVRALMDTYVSKEFQKLINKALGPKLERYHCHVADDAVPSASFRATGGLAIGSEELRAHRDAWEAQYEPEILKDLREVFHKPGGKKVTKEELIELAKILKESKLSKEQLKELMQQALDSKTGKLKFDEARENASKDTVPEKKPEKERKIDYEHAAKQNLVYQKMRGWDPELFVKIPGIQVDSKEFANAIFDMQEKIGAKADGIAGDDTLIAFYDKNGKKQDFFYQQSVAALEKQKAEKEKAAKEKAEKEKAAKGGGASPALDPSVKILQGRDVVAGEAKQAIPDGVKLYVHNVDSYVKQTEKGPAVEPEPKVVTLDIWVDGKHEIRIQDVAVKNFYIGKAFGYGVCYREIWLDMADGVNVSTSKGTFVRRSAHWCWGDE